MTRRRALALRRELRVLLLVLGASAIAACRDTHRAARRSAASGVQDASASPSSAQRYALDKPTADAIDVVVEPAKDTGTTHFATRVVVGAEPAALVLATPDDALEKGRGLVPLVERQLRVAPDRFLLLGWSSQGAGMQTDHALLVARTPSGVRVVDELSVTAGRGTLGFSIDAGEDRLRLGVAGPPGPTVHSAGEWALGFGRERLDLAGLRRLSYVEPGDGHGLDAYCPPFGTRPWAGRGRFAWFDVRADGFHSAAEARAR